MQIILILFSLLVGTCLIFYLIGNYFNLANTYTYKFAPVKLEEAASYIRNQLTPRGFEFFIAELFKALGHKAEVTLAELDWGRDVIVDDGKILIECKRYLTSFVGRDICFKLIGSSLYHRAEKCIIVNTGRYNEHAYTVAKEVDMLELWDMVDIMIKLREIGEEKTNEILKNATILQGTVLELVKEDDELPAPEGI